MLESDKVINVNNMKNQYTELFSETLGKMKGVKAKIDVQEDSKPRFFKSRPVPISLQEKVKSDITHLRGGCVDTCAHQ